MGTAYGIAITPVCGRFQYPYYSLTRSFILAHVITIHVTCYGAKNRLFTPMTQTRQHCAVCSKRNNVAHKVNATVCTVCVDFFRRYTSDLRSPLYCICRKRGKTFVERQNQLNLGANACRCCRLQRCFDAGMRIKDGSSF